MTTGQVGALTFALLAVAHDGWPTTAYSVMAVAALLLTADNRWIETPDGFAKCPRCEQKARTA